MSTVKRLSSLGAGGHARLSHFAVYEGVVITGIYDPSPESVAETLKLVGPQVVVYETPQELLGSDTDAVLIMGPDDTHPELLEMVVRARRPRPVFCEKPLAIDPEGMAMVNRALQTADSQGLLVASCHARRDRHNADLPYGWVKANFDRLQKEFGPLRRIGLNSIYPRPAVAWKQQRSFLLDKFVHDIDYLRFLLGDVPFTAERLTDGHDHYGVSGTIGRSKQVVRFDCQGTRLHSAKGEFIETIVLNFKQGECTVYTKTGTVRFRDRRTGEVWAMQISPMDESGYTRVFRGIMRDFVVALENGPRIHTSKDLRVITEAAIALTAPKGHYSYAGT